MNYSLGIQSLKDNVKLPEVAGSFDHPAIDNEVFFPLDDPRLGTLIPSDDAISKFHYEQRNTGVLVRLARDGFYELPFSGDTDAVESVLVDVAPGISATLLLRSGGRAFHSQYLEIFVGRGARLHVGVLHSGEHSLFISKRAARLEEDAKITWAHVDTGSGTSISEETTYLSGEGSSARSLLLGVKEGASKLENHVRMYNQARRTNSGITGRYVLGGSAQGIFRGLINIGQDAFGSEGFQRHESLILSDGARVKAVPDLEIHNDEVKCSHAVAISRPSREQLFYIESRGIAGDEAVSLIRKGAATDLLSKIGNLELEKILGGGLGWT